MDTGHLFSQIVHFMTNTDPFIVLLVHITIDDDMDMFIS